jgi:PKD repeat protein
MQQSLAQTARRGGIVALIVASIPLGCFGVDAAHAAATATSAFYSMDEGSSASVLVDSSGRAQHGTIGDEVVRGVQYDGATAHRFPLVPTAQPPTHPEHLDRVPDSTLLDPGTSDYAVTVRYRTTNPFGNILQKGQNATAGGYWKFEAPEGIVTCLFKGSQGQQSAVKSVIALDDGEWHVVRCERTSNLLTMRVDGVLTQQLGGSTGTISNDRELTIGGKGVCDQITVTCDYFAGDIDYVRIEKGSSGAANVPPTAAFVPSCVGLICSFSAASSTDSDGAIQTYAWNFGDGDTASWSTATHAYSGAGSYTVTLTVTDDRGAVSTTSQQVTVEPIPEIISFVARVSASANTSDHSAVIPNSVEPGDALLMFFTENTHATIGTPTGVTGWQLLDTISGGYATTRVWRKIADSNDDGDTVHVGLSQQSKGNLIVAAYRGTSQGDPVESFARVADTTSSTSHSTPSAVVTEPQSWGVSYWMHGDATSNALTVPNGVVSRATGSQTGGGRVTTLLADSNASLPPGSYGGLAASGASSSSTSTAWTLILAPDAGPVVNVPPTAGFVPTCVNYACSFNTSTSGDTDGVIETYAWSFGDAINGSGASPNHTYANPGTYTITLTVTDDDGGTDTASASVTVPDVPPVNVISYVGRTTINTTSSTFTVAVPSTVQAGDALLLFFAEGNTTSVSTPSGVTGWQTLGSVTADGTYTRVWRKVAVASDAGKNVSVSLSGSVKAGFTVAAYRGTSTSAPVASFAGVPLTANSASRTTPVASVAGEQSWAVSYWTHKDSITNALTPPAGVTTRATGSQSSDGRVTILLADSNGLVPQGSYGGLTATAVAASTSASAWTIVLAPLGGPIPNAAPDAAFSSSCSQFDCTFDAEASSDSDGDIVSYAWNFGDGATSADDDPEHTYDDPGTYSVVLTVTDDDLATDSASTTVTVPVVAPVNVIAFIGQASSNENAISHSVTVPAATQAGDGMLLFFSENTTATISNPAGWTVLDTVTVNDTTTRVWRKIATGSDSGSSVTISLNSISKAGLSVVVYRGTSLVNPVATFARSSLSNTSATRTTPMATVSGSQSWAVSYWTHKDSATNALIPPAGVTVRASGTQTSGGRISSMVADSNGVVAAGSYGGLTATAAATSSGGTAWTIILAPIS